MRRGTVIVPPRCNIVTEGIVVLEEIEAAAEQADASGDEDIEVRTDVVAALEDGCGWTTTQLLSLLVLLGIMAVLLPLLLMLLWVVLEEVELLLLTRMVLPPELTVELFMPPVVIIVEDEWLPVGLMPPSELLPPLPFAPPLTALPAVLVTATVTVLTLTGAWLCTRPAMTSAQHTGMNAVGLNPSSELRPTPHRLVRRSHRLRWHSKLCLSTTHLGGGELRQPQQQD